MKGKRLLYSMGLCVINGATKRAEFLRKHKVFKTMGENCSIMARKVPLHAKKISIGNNVHFASNVGLITHDIANKMLNNIPYVADGGGLKEHVGEIVIGNNVFIGAGSRILYNVTIGNNVVIGAGSIVNKNIPDNSIAVGVPAKVIGTFDDFVKKRIKIDR